MAKIHRGPVAKVTENRSLVRAGRFFIDLGGPMMNLSFGGRVYVAVFVDDFTRMKWTRHMRDKSDTTEALKSFLAHVIMLAGLKIEVIHTDEGVEFQGNFQQLNTPFLLPHSIMAWRNARWDCSRKGPWRYWMT